MLITIGKCEKFYLYILGSAICKFFSLMLLGFNKFGLFGFCPTISSYNFMQSIFHYIGYIIFGIIFFYFKNIQNSNKESMEIKDETSVETYIYNSPIIHTPEISRRDFILLSIAFVLEKEIVQALVKEQFIFFNFWTMEIIFLFFLLKKYFVIEFYKHHKVSIIFIISVCSTLILITTFLPISVANDDKYNSYDNLRDKLGSSYYCILFIFLQSCLNFVYSYSRTYSKVLMQIKFISPFKLIFNFGVTGLPFTIIVSIISYFIGYRDNIVDYYNDIKSVLSNEEKYKFWVEIFLIYPLYSFTSSMELIFEMLTIYYLNPFYVLMTNNLYYAIIKLINFLSINTSNTKKIIQFLITEFEEVFAFLGYMVFLEILELNFCGLNEKLKSKLVEKGDIEFKLLSDINTRDIYLDENNDEE